MISYKLIGVIAAVLSICRIQLSTAAAEQGDEKPKCEGNDYQAVTVGPYWHECVDGEMSVNPTGCIIRAVEPMGGKNGIYDVPNNQSGYIFNSWYRCDITKPPEEWFACSIDSKRVPLGKKRSWYFNYEVYITTKCAVAEPDTTLSMSIPPVIRKHLSCNFFNSSNVVTASVVPGGCAKRVGDKVFLCTIDVIDTIKVYLPTYQSYIEMGADETIPLCGID